MGIESSSAARPFNMYYGESSSYPQPEHSQETTEEQKPLVNIGGICEPGDDQIMNVPEQYAVDGKTVKDELEMVAKQDESPSNVDHDNAFDDLDLESFDFPDIGDGSFLETNDLLNPIEANFDVEDMLDEYLNFCDADDDISKFISFESPQMEGNVESVDQRLPFIQVRAYS